MRNLIEVIQVMILIGLIATSMITWVLAIGLLDSTPVMALMLMLVGTVTGILAKLWIYGKN